MFSNKISIVSSTICASFAMAVLPQFASAQTTITLANPNFTSVSSYPSPLNGNVYANNWGVLAPTYTATLHGNVLDPTVRVGVDNKQGVSNYVRLGSSNFGDMGAAKASNYYLASTIYQFTSVQFQANTTYTLSFKVKNFGNSGKLQAAIIGSNAVAGAQTPYGQYNDFDESTIPTADGWVDKKITFYVAPDAATQSNALVGQYIGIGFTNVNGWAGSISTVANISLTAQFGNQVPEPGTYAMLAGMVITSGGMLVRRRRNK